MLKSRTEPVTVAGYRTFEKDGQAQSRRDGSLIEFLCYRVDGEARDREVTLHPSINGSRPAAGARVELVIESTPDQRAVQGRNGPYIKHVVRERVADFVPVK